MSTALRTASLTALLSVLLISFPTYASASDITLSLFRAVRLSETSISISFVTDTEAIGALTYSGAGERIITLTDVSPQIDHLFTVDELNPGSAYSFTITASHGTDTSYRHVVLISAEGIGEPGISIVPGVQMYDQNDKLVAAQLAASTTPIQQHTLPMLLGISTVAVAAAGWVAYTRFQQRRHDQRI
jgi:hypothetical protein